MKILLFQIYGNQRIYHLELTYSVLSAARFIRDDPSEILLVLAADANNQRPDLPVEHLLLTHKMLDEWQMGGTYKHAIQAYALHHAVQYYDAPVILVDSDTIVREHPRRMFNRIAPGKTLMHKREGKISDTPEWPEWQALMKSAGGKVGSSNITPDSIMFNAGVLGIDPQDAPLMEEVKAAMRDIRGKSDVFTAVQMAASLVFEAKTELSVCDDIVDHYWDGPRSYYHYQMNQMYPDVMIGKGIADGNQPIKPLSHELAGKLQHRVAARIKTLHRRAEPEYGYAYMAYLSAISLRRTDPELANVWASTALNMLRFGLKEKKSQPENRDFRLFTPKWLDRHSWLQPELRDRWLAYWKDTNSPSVFNTSQ